MTYWGNNFNFFGRSWFALDASNKKISHSFTAPENKTVDKVRINYNVVGTPPTYRVGIQQDDGTGKPDGTFLGYGDFTPSVSGWNWANVDISNVSLTAGQKYHIVVQYQSGTIDGNNNMRVKYGNEFDQRVPYDLSSNTGFNVVIDSGSGWVIQNRTPIFVLVYTDATMFGQPWQDIGFHNLYGVRYFGEQFQVQQNITISHIGLIIRKIGSPSAFYICIYNVTDSQYVLQDEQITEAIGTSFAWVDHALSSNISLQTGKTYQIFGKSPNSDSANYYQLQYLECLTTEIDDTTFYGDTTCKYCSTTSGTVPLNVFETFSDLQFRFTLVEIILKQWSQIGRTVHTLSTPTRYLKLAQSNITGHTFLHHKTFKLINSLNMSHIFTRHKLLGFANNLNISHIIRTPVKFIKQIQTLRTIHAFLHHKIFKLTNSLNISHVFTRHKLLTFANNLNTSHILRIPVKFIKLIQALRTLGSWTLPVGALKQWFATLQTTHVFRRPLRIIMLTQTLRTIHMFLHHKMFALSQTLRTTHVFTRPFRFLKLTQNMNLTHILKANKLIKFLTETLKTLHNWIKRTFGGFPFKIAVEERYPINIVAEAAEKIKVTTQDREPIKIEVEERFE